MCDDHPYVSVNTGTLPFEIKLLIFSNLIDITLTLSPFFVRNSAGKVLHSNVRLSSLSEVDWNKCEISSNTFTASSVIPVFVFVVFTARNNPVPIASVHFDSF